MLSVHVALLGRRGEFPGCREGPKNSFEYARGVAETGALRLMRCLNIRFGIEDGSGATAAEMVADARHFLDEARRTSSLTLQRKGPDSFLLPALDTQIHTNLIAWHVLHSRFFNFLSEPFPVLAR